MMPTEQQKRLPSDRGGMRPPSDRGAGRTPFTAPRSPSPSDRGGVRVPGTTPSTERRSPLPPRQPPTDPPPLPYFRKSCNECRRVKRSCVPSDEHDGKCKRCVAKDIPCVHELSQQGRRNDLRTCVNTRKIARRSQGSHPEPSVPCSTSSRESERASLDTSEGDPSCETSDSSSTASAYTDSTCSESESCCLSSLEDESFVCALRRENRRPRSKRRKLSRRSQGSHPEPSVPCSTSTRESERASLDTSEGDPICETSDSFSDASAHTVPTCSESDTRCSRSLEDESFVCELRREIPPDPEPSHHRVCMDLDEVVDIPSFVTVEDSYCTGKRMLFEVQENSNHLRCTTVTNRTEATTACRHAAFLECTQMMPRRIARGSRGHTQIRSSIVAW